MSGRKHFRDYAALAERFSDPAGGRAAQEALDLSGLGALRGEERQEAIAVMREHLEGFGNDPRIVDALVEMQAPDLEALLRKTMRHMDQTGVAAAQALWERAKDPAVVATLTETLVKASNDTARKMAALALARTQEAAAADALLAALDEEDGAGRNVVIIALLRLAGLSELEQRGRSPISRLGTLVMNPLRAVREPAIAELRRIVQAVRSGQTAESLGLAPGPGQESAELGRLRQSVFSDPRRPGPWRRDVDLAAFRSLSGEERERGLQFLYTLLGKRDGRAVRDFSELGLRAAVPALREAADQGDRAFSALAQETIVKLSFAET